MSLSETLRNQCSLIVNVTCCSIVSLSMCTAISQESSDYAFTHVNVLTMDSADVLLDQTVVISGEKIVAIGATESVPVPHNALIIDAPGRYLMPGLAEMHGHVPGNDDQQYLKDVLFLYIANGVTTVRGMQGEPSHLELRAQLANHEILGPRFITSGPGLRGSSLAGPDDARQTVLAQASAGYDFIKLLPGLSQSEFNAVVIAANEVDISIAGHVSVDVGVSGALDAGQATIDHLDGYIQYLLPPEIDHSKIPAGYYGVNLLDLVDENRITQAAIDTRKAGVSIVPTQALIEHTATPSPTAQERAALPEMAYMPPEIIQRWVESKERNIGRMPDVPEAASHLQNIRKRLIKAMHDEGVNLLLGSDAPQTFNVPGISLHQELKLIIEAGLSPYEALLTGTAAPAEFFDLDDEFGRIRTGLAADLILVENNPLENIDAGNYPLGVMVRGIWLDRATLDDGLATIAARHR